MSEERLRLGFPVKVMGDTTLKSNDARRWANNPHLKVSLEYLDAIFDYLVRRGIDMYRMSSHEGTAEDNHVRLSHRRLGHWLHAVISTRADSRI